jgi:hypothetical protein
VLSTPFRCSEANIAFEYKGGQLLFKPFEAHITLLGALDHGQEIQDLMFGLLGFSLILVQSFLGIFLFLIFGIGACPVPLSPLYVGRI